MSNLLRLLPNARSLQSCIDQRRDNFLLLRVLAASLVIFGHSWATANNPSGITDWVGQQTGMFSGTVAVDVFFWISGFLVTMSYARRQSPIDFAVARILRIFPALIVHVLFCALLLGALVTTLPLREYFANPQVAKFISGNIMLVDLQWVLPGVFETNAKPAIVNGCLWTLPAELRMYEIVLGLGLLHVLRGRAWRLDVALAVLAFVVLWVPSIELLSNVPEFVEFAAFFAVGAACYIHRRHVPVHGAIGLALVGVAWALKGGPGYPLAFSAVLAYGSLWFAYGPRLPSLERFGDCSYGLYLYGYPLQQVVAMLFPSWGPWRALTLSFPLALLCAIASWHAVEKPALRIKRFIAERRPRARTLAAAG